MKQEQIYKKRLRALIASASVCLFAFMASIALQGIFILFFGVAFGFLAGHLFYACHIGRFEIDQIQSALMSEAKKEQSVISQTVAGVAIETDELFDKAENTDFEMTGDDEQFIQQSLENSTYRRRSVTASLEQAERSYGRASGI